MDGIEPGALPVPPGKWSFGVQGAGGAGRGLLLRLQPG